MEEAERQVKAARGKKVTLRQASLDPLVAFSEETKRNNGLKKRVEDIGKALLRDAEALESPRES